MNNTHKLEILEVQKWLEICWQKDRKPLSNVSSKCSNFLFHISCLYFINTFNNKSTIGKFIVEYLMDFRCNNVTVAHFHSKETAILPAAQIHTLVINILKSPWNLHTVCRGLPCASVIPCWLKPIARTTRIQFQLNINYFVLKQMRNYSTPKLHSFICAWSALEEDSYAIPRP